MVSPDDNERRSFHEIRCRDRLWHTFVQMSEEQDKSVDDLINDAMTGYAQIAGYETAVNADTPAPTPVPVSATRSEPAFSLPLPLPSPPVAARFGRTTAAQGARPGGRGGAPPPPPEANLGGSMLYLMFDNQKYRIDKDQFIIGRGTKSSDLPIKDGNISRKHAAVVRRNGTFFIKDLGSTNGIDFNGMRIDNKRIDEGDVFHICEYELKFTYKR